MGYHQSLKAGFGAISTPEITAKNSVYLKPLFFLQKEADEEKTLAKTVQLKLQGQWTKWCSFFKSILRMPSSLLSFCLGATYDTLPSPSNLHRWNIITETSSKLCHKQICSTAHVFGACKFVLQRAGLLFDTVLFWMPLFLYSNLFFYHIMQFQKQAIRSPFFLH